MQRSPQPAAIRPAIWAICRTADSLEKIQAIAGDKSVTGLIYYTSLLAIEPQEGAFNWSGIDRILSACHSSGKPLKLAILGGRWVPQWLYDQGAQQFTWTHSTPYVEAGKSSVSAPVPWDPVYLAAMQKALRACAERYKSDPSLAEVQITGPALANGLELNLSITPEQAGSIGYTPEKLTDAWKKMMDFCAAEFPQQSLSLALHNDLLGERTASLASVIRDYGINTYGKRLNLLVCYATYEPWFHRGNSAVDVWAGAPDSTRKEAQLIDLFSAKKTAPDKVASAIRQSAMLGAATVEIFADDIYSGVYGKAIESVLDELATPQTAGSETTKTENQSSK